MVSRIVSLVYFVGLAVSLPIRREVPQEHSHNKQLASVRNSLNLNNPLQIGDPVFALLGNAAAAQGLGDTTDPDCLQQAVADQAFTNAKEANDVDGQIEALIFRALERNTGQVGLASAPCKSVQPVNPEIAAIQQHQDPASPNAAATNKAIVLELAKQIASVGGDPQDALLSGTFAPGNINDPTAAGNTCDDANDEQGCIFTQNLLVADATAEEIQDAVGGGSGVADNSTVSSPDVNGAGNSNATASADDGSASNSTSGDASDVQNSSGASTSNTNSTSSQNLQTFSGALGGVTAPPVTAGGRGFVVQGSDDFQNIGAALGRSCDIQHNQCADLANSAAGRSSGLTTQQCDQQDTACKAAGTGASASTSTSVSISTSSTSTSSASESTGSSTVDVPEPSANNTGGVSDSTSGQNLQTFGGSLGGISAPPVTTGGRGFVVQGSDDFQNIGAALGRSCDIQHNQCADLANSAAGRSSGLTTQQCDQQDTACRAAATAAN